MARKSLQQVFENNLLDEVILSLRDGAHGSGVTLTQDECVTLLKKLPPLRQPPKWWRIAQFSFQQGNPLDSTGVAIETENEFGDTEAAIEATMKEFHVARQTVFDARRRYREFIWM